MKNLKSSTLLLCLATLGMATTSQTALADTPDLAPPSGAGVFIYNADQDMAHADSNGTTQITKSYPLDPHTNWYLYPTSMYLDCTSGTAQLSYGSYGTDPTKFCSDLAKYYKINWQPNMDSSHQVYILPNLDIDRSCNDQNNFSPVQQLSAAQKVARIINKADVDGIEVDLESDIDKQPEINFIKELSQALSANKRLAIYSSFAAMNKRPSDAMSFWPALNRASGCDNNTSATNCDKGFAIPTVYDSTPTTQSENGSIGSFYQQASYVLAQGLDAVAGYIDDDKTKNADAGNNYYMQPAFAGSSSANNAASYLTTDNPQDPGNFIQSDSAWGKNYQESGDTAWQTKTGTGPDGEKTYYQIDQYYTPQGGTASKVSACQYLCSGLGTYTIIDQLLAQTNTTSTADYRSSSPFWSNISNNLKQLCGVDTAFDTQVTMNNGSVKDYPIPPTFIQAISGHQFSGHVIGPALFQLNYSPLVNGKPQDFILNKCLTEGCQGVTDNYYPYTMSPTAWTTLTNWITQKDSNGNGWLNHQALSDIDNQQFARLLATSLTCQPPTPPGPESISWSDSAYALQVPNGVRSDGTIQGASLDADAKLENPPQSGDVLTYACGIYTADHSARVSGSTCMVAPSGTERALMITGLNPSQAYAIYVSATVTRNGTTVPSATIPWIKLWKDIPAATHSESISWPLNDAIADISIPTGYTDGKLSGALIANAVLLNPPKDGSDAINYECGVYDSSMQHQISGATCKIGESTNRLHTVSVTGLPTTPTPLIIHFSASVLRDGKTTVSPNIIPWIKVNKNTTAS